MADYPKAPRDEVTELRYALAMAGLELWNKDFEAAFNTIVQALREGGAPELTVGDDPVTTFAKACFQPGAVRDQIIAGPQA